MRKTIYPEFIRTQCKDIIISSLPSVNNKIIDANDNIMSSEIFKVFLVCNYMKHFNLSCPTAKGRADNIGFVL